uniref:Ryanodine receptor n=2 Tax=Caenorhabditis japonica TaxID=281687 RepID=A0A8R1HP75_CAEJA
MDYDFTDVSDEDHNYVTKGDIVCLSCVASHNRDGVLGSERVCLCTEGFGNRMCTLENVSDKDIPPDIAMCMLYIDNALSMRALQEMMSADSDHKSASGAGGHKTLLYGHAVQLKHVQSEMYLACLSSCSSNDKLAFDVGVQETNEGEACWWTIHPASKQRSEGEKVRVGDDVILVSVATERYLHMAYSKGYMVIASFHQTLWNIQSVSSGSMRTRNMGFLFGNDVLRLFHGNDECLTIPENWSEHPQHNMVIYEGGPAVTQARSLWRVELVRMKWHGALVGWEQVFRIKHITSGRYLGVLDNSVQLYHKEKADFELTAFVMCQNKDPKKQMLDEKEEEGMGNATIRYGETNAFIQHVKTQLWLSYQTSEVTKKGLGKVEEKKAVALKDGHMDDCYTFFMALEEESKSARVIRKCSSVLNKFLKGIDALQLEGNQSTDWTRVDLNEVLKLMEDLIEYFAQPNEEQDFEEKQNHLRALRSRQDLFQEEGVLNMILDTIDKFSQMEALPDFAGLIGEETHVKWEQISTYLYLLVAAMIKGNHYNCAQFASAQRLDWLFGRLSNPQSAEGILDVLYCVLTESPEALNMINEGHIRSVISLLEKVGRDPKVLDVLSSLCEGNGMAVRSSQNLITQYLLPGKDLLLQTSMRDHVSSMMPNVMLGVVEDSALFRKWYFEAEVEHIETMTKQSPYLRIGWANSVGFKPFPGSGDKWGCNGVGDDFYSYGFDGKSMFFGGKSRIVGHKLLEKGDVIGCSIDLTIPEIRFSVNGIPMSGTFKNFNIDGYFFPVMSLSAKVSCRFIIGGNQGKLKHGPPSGFSAVVEAINGELSIADCLSFGDLPKNIYCGPQTIFNNLEPFIPTPIDISTTQLSHHAMEMHQKYAENLHELWAMRKIELGWAWGEIRSETSRKHPCLTHFNQLPETEKKYNTLLALSTMKTIEALGYHLITDEPPCRLRAVRLAPNFQQANGYKPGPLDTHEIQLPAELQPLIEALARNTHNVWAKEKIRRGWTFGLSEHVDATQKRSPHLVPYEQVDERIKQANRESASENIKALQLFGIFLEPPAHEHDEVAEKELKARRDNTRTYRAEATYAVNGGKWYFEFEILTAGFMKIGWMDIGSTPEIQLGADDRSYAFDGYLGRKWHQGAETYGKEWKIGDVVGCFLDLNDRTISFSLNGELLLDPSGSEMAFDNVVCGDGLVPAMTLGSGQRGRLNFGQVSNSLKFFTTCGLQEGYEPFCVNMYRSMPMWFAKQLPRFEDISALKSGSILEVSRIPATGNSPPCLKLLQKVTISEGGPSEKAKMEYIRLSLPVKCNDTFVRNKDKDAIPPPTPRIQTTIPISEKKGGFLRSMLGSKDSHESDDDRRSRTNSKQPSFDGDEPPAVRRSLLELPHDERQIAEDHLRDMSDRSAEKPKKGGLLSRLRDSSNTRKNFRDSDKRRDDKAAAMRQMKSNSRSFDAGSLDTSTLPTGQKDVLASSEMPISGPGRQLTIKRGSFKKGKKGKKAEIAAMEKYEKEKKGSIIPMEAQLDVLQEGDAHALVALKEKVDEFYYGIRIFPGQDPSQVWVGWVTTQYHYYNTSFDGTQGVRKCRFSESDHHGTTVDSVQSQNCYMVNVSELLATTPDVANTKVSGTLIGCIIDTSIGELSFQVGSSDTGIKFKLEPGAMLFPAAFVTPTATEILQFELGRIKYTFPLSAAMFKSCEKSLVPFCPPRLTVEQIESVYWARVPNETLRTTALKLSEVRGWSVLCNDPVRIMTVYIPEKDQSFDILEMIEMPEMLEFHRQTLNLYCKLASHGNHKVAHTLCQHVDEDQIMYAIKSHYLSGPMRQGFHDLLIGLHLMSHTAARNSMAKEYVIPLVPQLQIKNVLDPDNESRFPQITGESVSMLSQMAAEPVKKHVSREDEMKLLPPSVDFDALKKHVMDSLRSATHHAVMNCRDLIGGDNTNHFEPLFKLFDQLLVIGLINDEELECLLKLIHPQAFDETFENGTTQKGLTQLELAEPVKLQLVNIIDHLCDIQLRYRIESLVAFTEGFVGELQSDQCKRYMEIKQTDMPPAEAAKKTKEFRCPPKEQMFRLLMCKVKEEKDPDFMEEDADVDQCPMAETLQQQLRDFCNLLVGKIGNAKEDASEEQLALIESEEASWVDSFARLVVKVPPPLEQEDGEMQRKGTQNFREMIVNMLRDWAQAEFIESKDLIRSMFKLLLRQYSGIREIRDAMSQAYVFHERNELDVKDFIVYLIQIRELLTVQFEHTEEAILKRGLWKLMNNRIFFQHPDLMRLLSVHENVMSIMMNILTAQQGTVEHEGDEVKEKAPIKDASEMVVACSRFLCYFCRTSRQNQKAMFEHLSFLLDNATMLLARPSLRGSVPLDVAYSSFMDNNELALALKEEELDKVAVYLSRCGLQPNSELITKGYPDIGWDPVEGERYIDFLRFCVWINGENVEENANLVIRLLIRRPECLGVALKGEGQGLYSAFKEAIALSEDIRVLENDIHPIILTSGLLGENPTYPSKDVEGEDYIDLGAATLDFYSSLVDLLAKCAPDPMAIQAGKGDSLRARAILRSLISLDDLGKILALRFTIPNLAAPSIDDTGPLPGLLPNHKGSVLLFLDRVYGIDQQDMLFHFLEQSFLPDLRAATMMDSPRALESDTALALNRYLCNSVLPLLTNHSHFFADAEHHSALLDATVHTVYRMNRLKSLTKNQRDAVSDFLVAITRELPPAMMIKLLKKVINDILTMNDMNVLVPLRLITLHYERCGKYYGSGNHYGVASEQEKRLSMLLFDAIFDTLGSRPYDPELFGKALPCMTAIGSAISPDYTLTSGLDGVRNKKREEEEEGAWIPRTVDVSKCEVNRDLEKMTELFAEHFHDSWASRKLEKGWVHGDLYSRANFTHPRLKPFALLRDFEKSFYKERCAECLKALMAWNYSFEMVDRDANDRASAARTLSGTSISNFAPKPIDLSSMTLEKDMVNAAEKMAEHSHLIWAKKVMNDLNTKGGFMPIPLVPWDLLTDFERRKDRFRASEILKFLQYHGYHVNCPKDEQSQNDRMKIEGERSSVEKRFAYNLLEKLITYLEQASLKMKSVKPSQELTRRNSFKKEGQDVKFFEKVVLPLMHAYFNAHKNYFLEGSSIVQTGTASNKEKEMVANLFCRLAALLRIKNRAFGSVAKITVKCLQGLTQALDLRTLVKVNSDIVRTSLLTFFNNCADDLYAAVNELKDGGQYSLIRGQALKSWNSFEFANQMIVPVLTTMFAHLARNHFGTDLLLDDIQAACYKILDSLYMVTGLNSTISHRKSISNESEKHRPGLGQCLAAFASCFPVAFLEPEFNKSNKFSVLAKSQDQSVQVQEMLQNLSTHIPHLEKLLTDIETVANNNTMYSDVPNVYDVDLPLMCSYMAHWFSVGPEGKRDKEDQRASIIQTTSVGCDHINRIFNSLLRMIRNHVGIENAPWLCRVNFFAVQIIQNVTSDPVREFVLPIAERLRRMSEKAYKEEEHMRTHPDDADEGTVAEDNARLVRDTYAFFPILMKYTDLHRAQWLKSPTWETDGVYENVAVIFRIWSQSQHFKREELNYVAQFEEDAAAMGGGDMKTGKAAIAERKKKRREGQDKMKEYFDKNGRLITIKKDKHASSIVIACLKRLLPVGLNVFGGRELDIVQQSKEKFIQKEMEEKIREFIKGLLEIPVKTDPTDKNAWQLSLYRKIGKSQMRGKDEMTQEAVIEKIFNMGQVSAILHTMTSRMEKEDIWKKVLTLQRKRMAISLITASHLYKTELHRGINFFLPAFSRLWLEEEDMGQDQLIADICSGVEEEEGPRIEIIVEEGVPIVATSSEDNKDKETNPDPLKQLIRCFQRAATSEETAASAIHEDSLYIRFADVMAKSIHIEEEDGEDGDEGEIDQAAKEEQSQALRSEQAVLASRGAAIMCLMYLSASGGEPNEMVAQTLQLGIHLLSGGNVEIQKMLIEYLQLKKDVRFFTSMAGLMNKCSVLNLEMFERQIKAEGLGMGAELASGDNQNLNDADFTCSLFRFLQLTCEGHNIEFQNYLRTQPGHTTSVNLINCTVDYLLRLQESVMDFYWHYSSKEVIDEGGKEYFLRAIQVCSQVFNTLTESIQGPCVGNQMTLANSRLWDAINGFFFLFAHMMEKLYKNSTQLELLREFLNLQKDMIVLMLSMLEGNVLNGSIGKQMVDALVESQPSVEKILKFSDMFLKLKDLTTSQAFQDFDTNRDGWISPKEFQRAMESQKMYTVEDITYLMMCTDVNNDGKVDYMEFTERFHNPARDIGFNLAVLLVNLKEHITNDPRLEKIIEKAQTLLEYFDPFLGRIEIMGSSKRVEKIYFEIQESWLEQWGKQQIRDSKNSFLFNVLQDDGGDQGKLEAFINFCEDTIFEMQHAAAISSGDSDTKMERAIKQRDYFLQQTTASDQISETFKSGYNYGISAASALSPQNISTTIKNVSSAVRQMTWTQLLYSIVLLFIRCGLAIGWGGYLLLMTVFRFAYFLTTSSDEEDTAKPEIIKEKPPPMNHEHAFAPPPIPDFHHTHVGVDAFGVGMNPDQLNANSLPDFVPPPQSDASEAGLNEEEKPLNPEPASPSSPTAAASKAPSIYESIGAPQMVQLQSEADFQHGQYEPKIAESNTTKSRGSILNMLARNFKTIEKITLYLAFFINVILLFHRVDISPTEAPEAASEGDDDEDATESIFITGMQFPYVEYEITGWMLAQILYWISVLHLSTSFALLVSFYQLKIPLITFKREKEIARKLMFDGCWITEEDSEELGIVDTFMWYLDRIVVSAKSFPMMYWDKFVRRKTRSKFKDQVDEETLTSILGEEKMSTDSSYDYRYSCWLWLGVILTNGQFLYRVGYLLCSACGVFLSPFFYAFHLIDVVLSFPMLKAILQSVTHNLQQLILTIMMTLVVVYLYTVIAFNFFRKFYVQEGEDGEEPDRKCHNMLTCFIYHFYAGVRAGGGIGDELESPYGDDLEYPRMFYDISFFFFVIIILLAIMQGLIIDAFGELRDQQESATEKLESSCFICDIGKETFDRMPRGFEIHTTKEHNFANYLFFLQHLVNKDETEYTGQETYVREKYDNRDWDFFPVGECFVKQYEDQLLQS